MKDILIFDDPQKDEFIEIFKAPPIPLIEVKKTLERQGNVYILVSTSPWTDYLYFNKLLYERAHLSAPRGGRAGSAETSEAKDGTLPGNFGGNTVSRTAQTHDRENAPRELRTRDAGTPPSTVKAHSYAPDERRPAWVLAERATLRPWRTKGKLQQTRHICRAHS